MTKAKKFKNIPNAHFNTGIKNMKIENHNKRPVFEGSLKKEAKKIHQESHFHKTANYISLAFYNKILVSGYLKKNLETVEYDKTMD